jgi:glutamine amidotransferase-like uncharacterized protein
MRTLVPFAIALAFGAIGACTARDPNAPVLVFTGTGTSPNDVTAILNLLARAEIAHDTATSDELNAMEPAALRQRRLIIVPGGNFIEIGAALTPAAAAKVRAAVHDGVNYLGICAGGFLAGRINGHTSFDLTNGVQFPFYAISGRGIRKAAVPIARRGQPTLEHYWEDGPQFTGWGEPAATYPDGTPAIVEGDVGSGWVVLVGVHPEAPENWRAGMTFRTPASADQAFATTLIRAALDRTPLAPR